MPSMHQEPSTVLTKEGYEKLQQELDRLIKEDRPKAIEMVANGRSYGDLSENAEYETAKEYQSRVESRIQQITQILAHANIITMDSIQNKSQAYVGAYISIEDEATKNVQNIRLVGEVEADFYSGLISITSPLGSAILGKSKGDHFDVLIKGSEKSFVILSIDYK